MGVSPVLFGGADGFVSCGEVLRTVSVLVVSGAVSAEEAGAAVSDESFEPARLLINKIDAHTMMATRIKTSPSTPPLLERLAGTTDAVAVPTVAGVARTAWKRLVSGSGESAIAILWHNFNR